jgi:hypothetical protein
VVVCFVDISPIDENQCLNFLLMWWFSPGTPVSSTNKTDCDDITEILLKVALNTLNLNLRTPYYLIHSCLPDRENNSTNINKTNTTTHIKSLNTKKTMTYAKAKIKNKFVSPYPTDTVKIGRLKYFY